jgi:hypothetical protein
MSKDWGACAPTFCYEPKWQTTEGDFASKLASGYGLREPPYIQYRTMLLC